MSGYFKKAIAVIMVVVMTLTAAPLSGFVGLDLPSLFDFKAEAATCSGTYGTDISWEFDESTGTLSFWGTGGMVNKSAAYYQDRPWYSYRDKVKKIELSKGITSIGTYAFEGCYMINEITIPDGVKSIGLGAFGTCSSLTSITIPISVATIGDKAFYYCTNLDNVYYSGTETQWSSINIGSNNSWLNSATIHYNYGPEVYSGTCGDNLTWSFDTDTGVLNITGTGAMTNWSSYTYVPWHSYRSSIKTVNIGNSVTTIGNYAFYDCNSPASVTIPGSVTTIGIYAFFNCDSLTSITIPNSVTTIGDRAFCFCDNLTSVTIPDSVTTIGERAFYSCDSLTDVYYTGTQEQWNEISIESGNSTLTSATIHYGYVPETPDTPSTPESERKTRIIVNKGTLNYFVGEDIVLVVTEEENGGYYIPDKITLTNSDDSVAVLENIYSYSQFKGLSRFSDFEVPTEYRNSKFIVMTAKKSGVTAVTINDNTTQDTYTFPINVSVDDYVNLRANQIKTYDYKITQLNVNDTYNAYYNGMYVADFSYEKVSGGWNFNMNIYNQTYVNGVVEIYDKTGNLIKVEMIDKYQGTGTGLLETLGTGWSMLTEAFKGDTCSFRGVSFSKETKIKDLFVPQDGYVAITNDSAVSTTCFVLNLFDVVLTGGSLIKDVMSFSELEVKEIEKELLGRFVASEYYLKTASKFQEKLTEKVFENISEATLSTVVATLSGEADDLLMDIGLDFDDVVKSALGTAAGIGEGILTKYSNIFGYSLAVMFTAQKVLNYLVQLDHWKDTTGNGNPFGFVTPLASSSSGTVYGGSGIGVDTNGNVSSDVIVQSYRVLKDTITVELSTGEILNDYVAYDISLVKDGKAVQPNGTVTVHIPFPAEFEGSRIQVIRENEDGSWSLIDSTVENGMITFGVNHFCLFVIAPVEATYTLSYSANGGSGAPSSQKKDYGAALTLSTTQPTRTGYTFTGWNTEADGTGTSYASGASYTANATVTLYAQWKANTYTVKYNANGGSGTMSNSSHTYGVSKALTANAFKKSGYTFLGWATSSSATTATYTDGQSVKNLTSTNGGTVTLYAVWSDSEKPTISIYDTQNIGGQIVVTIDFSDNIGIISYYWGTNSSPSSDEFTSVSNTTSMSIAETVFDKGTYYIIVKDTTGNMTTTSITFNKIIFDANGGNVSPSYVITNESIILPTPTRSNYTFIGWNTKADGTGTNYASGESYVANSSITLYAQWSAIELSSIAVKTNPTKTTYYVGDTLNTSGLTLTATYNNGTTKTISSGFTCTPTTLSTAGTQKITVTYGGKTATFYVSVQLKISDISIKTNPTKTTYYVGDTLDTSGLTLTATYNNGTTKTISSGFACTPKKLNTAGTQEITVTYSGKTATFYVKVVVHGTCGSNLTWTYDTELYELSIEGSGAMYDYSFSSHAPWYSYRSSIKTVTIGDNVTSIGNVAFHNCDSLTSVTIPDSVTTIGDDAFYGCSSLTSVYYIGDIADWCAINWGDIYSNPIYYAGCFFVGGELVTDLVIPNSVTTIGEYAFNGCDSLTSVTIGDSVTTIGDDAFNDCDSLESITIPDSVTTIGRHAFNACDSLASVTIGNNVTTISVGAFQYCASLTSIIIPDSVNDIDDYAFVYCSNLKDIKISKNVKHIGWSAFWNTAYYNDKSNWENNILYIDNYLIEYTNETSDSYVIKNGTKVIAEAAFYGCSLLSNIEIPYSIVGIGYSAFYNCTSLTDVYYSGSKNNWHNISIDSENECLTNAVIHYAKPDSISIHTNPIKTSYCVGETFDAEGLMLTAIYSNGSVETVSSGFTCTPEKLETVGTQRITVTYDGKTTSFIVTVEDIALTGIAIKTTPTKISYYAGDSLDTSGLSLTAIYNNGTTQNVTSGFTCTPEKLETVGTQKITVTYEGKSTTFDVNVKAPEVSRISIANVPEKLNYYVGDTLSTEGLEIIVTYNNGTTKIITSGFVCTPTTLNTAGAQKITVTYDGKTTSFDVNVIIRGNCGENLTWTLDIKTGTLEISGIGAMESYNFSDSNYAPWYNNKSDIKCVKIADGVTCIGDSAFYNCTNLTSVTISDSVTYIGEFAFYDCDNITSVIIPDNVTTLKKGAFLNCDNLANVTLGNGLKTIGQGAFERCYGLENIVIPDSVTTIDKWAFMYCENLNNITIGKGVAKIDREAIIYCYNLKSITVDVNNQYYSNDNYGVLFNKNKTTLIHYPEGNARKSYVIPSSVTTIGYAAFFNSSNLTNVTIHDSVTHIAYCAFSCCYNLVNVYYTGSKSKWDSVEKETFYSDLKSASLICCENIISTPSVTTLNYGETLVLHADVAELPEGWTIQWTVEGAGFNMAPAEDGLICKMTSVANGNATVKATLVDENGKVVLDTNGEEISDSQQLASNAGFFQKLISFFKNLFGMNRVIY